jgi:hypothetical protein
LVAGVGLAENAASADQRTPFPGPDDIIVYTAHQGFLSRIYLLEPDGSVITYFHYDNYFFADLEVVDNELYAAEAFAPRVLKVDLYTGDLEVIVDDLWLYYFYGVVFDGTHWYVDEWDLNRYEFDGTKDGVASFDEEVAGAAWDGTWLWTLNDDHNLIKCWDISAWPTLTEITANRFTPPSADCRGLWFDGEYLWTAESIDGALGKIYRFDFSGEVVDEWLEPGFRGWGAAVIAGEPFVLEVGREEITWSARYGAHSYDLVRGDLALLRDSAGDFSQSVLGCLADNHPESLLDHAEGPDRGEGEWYLLRGVSTAQNLTYDSGSAMQAAPRDAAVNAALDSCP